MGAFPADNGKGSRILVTTRSTHVASSFCKSTKDIFYMKYLSDEDSKKLLYRTVFETEKFPLGERHYLNTICEHILAKCKGVPLALVSIGKMLAQRKNEPEATLTTVIINRLPSALQTNSALDGMRRILSLSYNDLPFHMKACFLYLCAFPEDQEIRGGPLVRRWAAEGFISAVHGLSLEESTESCFNEFISRSIVSPEQIASRGGIRSFKVHDIMLDVITFKSIRENFITFLGSRQRDSLSSDKIWRLSLQPGKRIEGFSSRGLQHLRSLTINQSTDRPGAITFSDLTLLRVLDLEGCRWLTHQDLKDICKLSLLGYLSLRNTGIEKLPSMVGKLKALATLDVRQTLVRNMPRSITRLQNLNHILAGGYMYYTKSHSVKHFDYETAVNIPRGFGNMSALQRISFLDIKGSPHALREAEKLTNLTRLCAVQTNHDARWEHFDQSLSKLSSSLRYLSVMQYGDSRTARLDFLLLLSSPPLLLQSLHLMGKLSALPPWTKFLNHLASLSLRETYLETEMVAVLGKLPSLLTLKLYLFSYTESGLYLEKGQFLKLKQLVIDNLQTLDEISFRGGAPDLEKLSLALGRSGKKVTGLQKLSKLKIMELYGEILDPVVEDMRRQAERELNNPPRVTREDQLW